ncbi:hypothetical protein GCM10023231_33570 [Olivibacter ginsenosidimutans]|uniref:RNA polymerase sigma-70 region 2 domain-containing protein n=2 Tax=Olivibacter ginsenosidimutans TaxID=1176537 RepID=A0ABP9C0V0_9SPHI
MKEGDMEAFRHLYTRYKGPIFNFTLKYVRSVPLAEDITQDIFVKLWDNRTKLDTVRTLKSY